MIFSSFHYGAYTCEACKVFFRRSCDRLDPYVCQTKRENCFPVQNIFQCKSCRYRKCLDVGMSKSKIKIGRYSKERHYQNKTTVAVMEKKQVTVPYLLNYSDCQDLTIACHNSFSPLLNIPWESEIENFAEQVLLVQDSLQKGFFPKDQYHDIHKITGVEIDYRKIFTHFCEKIMIVNFKYFVQALRKLPGLRDLPQKQFMSAFLEQKEDLEFTAMISSLNKWNNETLTLDMGGGNSLAVSQKNITNISDPEITQIHIDWSRRIEEAKLTYEELTFMLSLNALRPTKGKYHLASLYDRFVLAFTRYLESKYGKSYHVRLQELVDLMVSFKLRAMQGFKWMKDNEEYLETMYESKLLKVFINHKKVNDITAVFDGIKL